MTAPPRPVRLGVLFNRKKQQRFLAPLWPQRTYHVDPPHGQGAEGGQGEATRVDIVVVEREEEVEEKGPFDILLLKLTDLMSLARSSSSPGSLAAQQSLQRVQESLARMQRSNPLLTLIDPLPLVEKLLDRAEMQEIVQGMDIRARTEEGQEVTCGMPTAFLYQRGAPSAASDSAATTAAADSSSAIATSVRSPSSSGLPLFSSFPPSCRFPVIVKSLAACGSPASHRMYVLQSLDDVARMERHHDQATREEEEARVKAQAGSGEQHGKEASIAASSTPAPSVAAAASSTTPDSTLLPPSPSPVWLVQQYVQHGGVLYKVYVLDEEVHVLAKPSLPDVNASSPPCWLNSQDMRLHPLIPQAEPCDATAADPDAAALTPATSLPSKPDTAPSFAAPSSAPLPVPAAVRCIALECVRLIRRELPLTLFGFDLLMEQAELEGQQAHGRDQGSQQQQQQQQQQGGGAGVPIRCHLIDINYFPSYKSVSDLSDKLLRVCLKKQREHAQAHAQAQKNTAPAAL